MDSNRILIFDTTLRDGEQSPGAAMSLDDKVRVALQLEELGVDIIEAGFPISSPGDFAAVQAVAREVKDSIVCALARAQKKDIERAAEALKPAARPRIHTFIATSPLHMQYKLNMTAEQVLEAIRDSVSHARNLCDNIEWSCEDGGRSERDYLLKAIETAIKAGATTINVPDTVGYTIPDEYGDLIRYIKNNVPNIDKAVISTHCHNDLGLAVANSLAGIKAGAGQVECTINGIGERAGNAALEELVMALKTRSDIMPFTTGIKTELITKSSRLVSSVTGYHVQPNKAIVGKNAFAHESGIHQDGMLKNAKTYEIMTPESVGLSKSALPLGKLSGRNAFKAKLKDLGYDLGDNALNDAFQRFKELADRKRHVYDGDLVSLMRGQEGAAPDKIVLKNMQVITSTEEHPIAKVEIQIDGKSRFGKMSAVGSIEAVFGAIDLAYGEGGAQLSSFNIGAVTEGSDAQAQVTVQLKNNEYVANGQGVSNDTLVACARAYIEALNKLINQMEIGLTPIEREAKASSAAI